MIKQKSNELIRKYLLVGVFIKQFVKKYPGTEYFFLNGGCKIFADILVNNFGGEMFDYKGHYITRIDHRYYDITGELYGIEEKKLNPMGSSPSIEKQMNNYENIFDLIIYDFFRKNITYKIKKCKNT